MGHVSPLRYILAFFFSIYLTRIKHVVWMNGHRTYDGKRTGYLANMADLSLKKKN
jgi:heme/copper-type cytochrome/quinol oxidase subunit 4